MNFFDIRHVAFELFGYPLSYVELIGTLFGLISVYLASKAHILTWATGIINEVCLSILFFQVQLYADMFLQFYFFITTLYGWYTWKYSLSGSVVSRESNKKNALLAVLIVAGTVMSGYLIRRIHIDLPHYFIVQASYPFIDSFVMVSSMIATILLAQKKIETWFLWIAVDIVCILLYIQKEIYFLAVEYVLVLVISCYALYQWRKQLQND
ncbi:MAG: nicotinamide mononucleotide transporter [Cytophagales bacterium]|nr:nicotinamide mononucleotide transporter [Cytophaga sp.]